MYYRTVDGQRVVFVRIRTLLLLLSCMSAAGIDFGMLVFYNQVEFYQAQLETAQGETLRAQNLADEALRNFEGYLNLLAVAEETVRSTAARCREVLLRRRRIPRKAQIHLIASMQAMEDALCCQGGPEGHFTE